MAGSALALDCPCDKLKILLNDHCMLSERIIKDEGKFYLWFNNSLKITIVRYKDYWEKKQSTKFKYNRRMNTTIL